MADTPKRGDLAHRWTDQQLAELEERIAKLYREAAEDLEKTINEYFAKFIERDKEMRELIGTEINGREWTEEDYKQWRLNQIGRGQRYEALQEKIAQRYTSANEVATAYINDATPGVYSLNRNFAAYQIENVTGNVGFDLFDEQTVKRLAVEQPDLMPYYPPKRALERGIDLAWGKKQIAKVTTSSILQGSSIPGIANALMTVIPGMELTSAVRAARTAMTGAQNAGRMDSYAAAQRMGIKLQKRWLATLDNRTRHEHRKLDGQVRDNEKPFEVDGYEIMFPGDPEAEGFLVYNCRCTLIAVVDGIDTSDAKRRAKDPASGKDEIVGSMTYEEWAAAKSAANPSAWAAFEKKGKNLSADRKQFAKYQEVLKSKAPKTLAEFQNLKYNEPEKWDKLRAVKHQTEFVNNAPCVTTPKKYTGYFLKPGAKHADQFFDVGYEEDNPLQLRYDMARQFDMNKAVNILKNNDGSTKFNIYMEIGVTKKRTFCTGWRIDKQGDTPRIITAFRSERGQKDAE